MTVMYEAIIIIINVTIEAVCEHLSLRRVGGELNSDICSAHDICIIRYIKTTSIYKKNVILKLPSTSFCYGIVADETCNVPPPLGSFPIAVGFRTTIWKTRYGYPFMQGLKLCTVRQTLCNTEF
jgi:hypothetical protein